MKDRNKGRPLHAGFVFGLTMLACACFTACENPIMEKWWVEKESGVKTVYEQLPPEVVPVYVEVIKEVILTLPPNQILQNVEVYSIDYILFSGGSTEFNEPGNGTNLTDTEMQRNLEVIRQTGIATQDIPNRMVMVIGHANPTTPADFQNPLNQELMSISTARANTVKGILSIYIPPEKIMVKGQGAKKVLDGAGHPELNRRAEIIIFEIDTEDA